MICLEGVSEHEANPHIMLYDRPIIFFGFLDAQTRCPRAIHLSHWGEWRCWYSCSDSFQSDQGDVYTQLPRLPDTETIVDGVHSLVH